MIKKTFVLIIFLIQGILEIPAQSQFMDYFNPTPIVGKLFSV